MALLRLSQAVKRIGIADARPAGLTPVQAQTLFFVRRTKSFLTTIGNLAAHLGTSHPTAVEVVNGLVARGLVVKRPDPRDRRVTLLALTPAGEEACARLDHWLDSLEEHLSGLDAEALDALERGLGAVIRSLQRAGLLVVGAPCRGCVHFREDAAAGAAEPHYCALIRRHVSEAEAAKDCPDHTPAA
ncbi:MAG: winged helix-turn-helix transcriptional regulator [Firmicutes bacterium]|nr:winged helix-turn-helix transcriptional regulator [Bacillota bacterium]